jgi:septum formation protein
MSSCLVSCPVVNRPECSRDTRMRLILASTSPRRKELLTLLGYRFDVCAPSFIEELDPARPAEEQAREFALNKAVSCESRCPESLILGGDTVIAVADDVIGKPRDRRDAAAMVRRLMGREHRICSAVAVVNTYRGSRDTAVATVRVWMKQWDTGRLAAYLQTGEGLGKAGAYSIQGAAGELVDRIEGDFTAAVGLPLRLAASMLAAHGLSAPVDIERLYRLRPYANWNRFA